MTAAELKDLKGKSVGQVDLEKSVFGIEPRIDLLHQALIRQLANARSGSANTKTRSEVRGGGRKPWRQKGTGRARAGSLRSPLFEGGGVVFGPKPRDFGRSMPKKVRAHALRSALAARAAELVVVKDFSDLTNPKTREMAGAFKNLGIEGKRVLVILDFQSEEASKVERAARNIKGVTVIHSTNLNVRDIMHAQAVLTTESVIESINNRLKTTIKPGFEAKAKQFKEAQARAKADREKKARGERARNKSKAEPEKVRTEPKVAKPSPEDSQAKARVEKPKTAKPKKESKQADSKKSDGKAEKKPAKKEDK